MTNFNILNAYENNTINRLFNGDFEGRISKVIKDYKYEEFIKIENGKFIFESRKFKSLNKVCSDILRERGWLDDNKEKLFFSYKDEGINLFTEDGSLDVELVRLLNIIGSVAYYNLLKEKSQHKGLIFNIISKLLYQFIDMLHSLETREFLKVQNPNVNVPQEEFNSSKIHMNYYASFTFINSTNIKFYRAMINYVVSNNLNKNDFVDQFKRQIAHLIKSMINGITTLTGKLIDKEFLTSGLETPLFNQRYFTLNKYCTSYAGFNSILSLDYIDLVPSSHIRDMMNQQTINKTNMDMYDNRGTYQLESKYYYLYSVINNKYDTSNNPLRDYLNEELSRKINIPEFGDKDVYLTPFKYTLIIKDPVLDKDNVLDLMRYINLYCDELTTYMSDVDLNLDLFLKNLLIWEDKIALSTYSLLMDTLFVKDMLNQSFLDLENKMSENFVLLNDNDIAQAVYVILQSHDCIVKKVNELPKKGILSFYKKITKFVAPSINDIKEYIAQLNSSTYNNSPIPNYAKYTWTLHNYSYFWVLNFITQRTDYSIRYEFKYKFNSSLVHSLYNLDIHLNSINPKISYSIHYLNSLCVKTKNTDRLETLDIILNEIFFTKIFTDTFMNNIRDRKSTSLPIIHLIKYGVIRSSLWYYNEDSMFKNSSNKHLISKAIIKVLDETEEVVSNDLDKKIYNLLKDRNINAYENLITSNIYKMILVNFYKDLTKIDSNLYEYFEILNNYELFDNYKSKYINIYNMYVNGCNDKWINSCLNNKISEEFFEVLQTSIQSIKHFDIDNLDFLSIYFETCWYDIHQKRHRIYGNQFKGLIQNNFKYNKNQPNYISFQSSFDSRAIPKYFNNALEEDKATVFAELDMYILLNSIFDIHAPSSTFNYHFDANNPVNNQIRMNSFDRNNVELTNKLIQESSNIRKFVSENKDILDKFFTKISRHNLFDNAVAIFIRVSNVIMLSNYDRSRVKYILDNMSSNEEIQFSILFKQTITNQYINVDKTMITTTLDSSKYTCNIYDSFKLHEPFTSLLIQAVDGKISHLFRYLSLSSYQNLHNLNPYLFKIKYIKSYNMDNLIKMLKMIIDNNTSIGLMESIFKIFTSEYERLDFKFDDINTLKEKIKVIESELLILRLQNLIPIKSLDDLLPKKIDIPRDYNYKGGYSIHFHEHNDPESVILGEITNCCQTIGGAAESSVLEGLMNPYSGFISFRKDGKIIAQSWIWLSVDKKTLVLDSIESRLTNYVNPITKMILDWAETIPYDVAIGCSYTKIDDALISKSKFKRLTINRFGARGFIQSGELISLHQENKEYKELDRGDKVIQDSNNLKYKKRELEILSSSVTSKSNTHLITDLFNSQFEAFINSAKEINDIRDYYGIERYPEEEFKLTQATTKGAWTRSHKQDDPSIFKMVPITTRSGYDIHNPANSNYRNDYLYSDAKYDVYLLKK